MIDIKVSESVFKRINFLRAKSNNKNLNLRISVTGGGCSGFIYNYSMVESNNNDDLIIEDLGSKVFVDPASQEFLHGSMIEFIEELGNSYFSIKNPSATTKCGCGNSLGFN